MPARIRKNRRFEERRSPSEFETPSLQTPGSELDPLSRMRTGGAIPNLDVQSCRAIPGVSRLRGFARRSAAGGSRE
jgi:hypothetical protein